MCDSPANGSRSSASHNGYRRYPDYSPSDFPWIGKIPSHWETTQLKYVANIEMGQSPPSEFYNKDGDGLPFLQGNADFGNLNPNPVVFCTKPSRVASADSILLSVRAPVGAVNIADRRYGIGRGLTSIKPDEEKIIRLFTWYTILALRNQLDPLATGSTYEAISKEDVASMIVSLPPLQEQQLIAAFLDRETAKIDSLIEKKQRLIELLEEKRTALISHAVTKGLDPDAPMKDSGVEWLGEIPAHWDATRLKFLGDARIGLTYSPSDVVPKSDGVLVLRASNIKNRAIVLEDTVHVDTDIPEKLITKSGDILICARSGSRALIGKNARIDQEVAGSSFGVFMLNFRSKFNDYLFFVFNSTLFEQQSSLFLTSTINQLTLGTINNIEVPFPPYDEQIRIASYLDNRVSHLDYLKIRLVEGVELLVEYRSSLISAAVTGKIDVRDQVEVPA